jgi:hypothetical protein
MGEREFKNIQTKGNPAGGKNDPKCINFPNLERALVLSIGRLDLKSPTCQKFVLLREVPNHKKQFSKT